MAFKKIVVLDENDKVPIGEIPASVLVSQPPVGSKKVVNIYVTPEGKLKIEYEE